MQQRPPPVHNLQPGPDAVLMPRMSGWVLYLLRCADGTLYTGVTNRLETRIEAHRSGKGARYTRGRGPLTLLHVEPCEDRGAALRREHAVKRLRRSEKFRLIRKGAMRSAAALIAIVFVTGCPARPHYPECKNDDQCADQAQVCSAGFCKECRDDAQCAQKPGTVCLQNLCSPKPECQENKDCAAGQKCAGSKCLPECTEATVAQDCGEGKKCREGRCAAEEGCQADGDCTGGSACVERKCVDQASILASKGSRLWGGCEVKSLSFDFDEATLSRKASSLLEADFECLRRTPYRRLSLTGHTDERGTTEYNLALGARRSEAVKKYLVKLGADPRKLRAISYGEERPLDPGHTDLAWAKNRRVELVPEEE